MLTKFTVLLITLSNTNELLNEEMVANVSQCRNLWFHKKLWGGIKDAAEWTAKAGETAFDWTKEAGEDAFDWTKEAGKDAFDWSKEAGEDAWNTMKKLPKVFAGQNGGTNCGQICEVRGYSSFWVRGTSPSCEGSCGGDCYTWFKNGSRQASCIKQEKFDGHNVCLTGKKICCCYKKNYKPKPRPQRAYLQWKMILMGSQQIQVRFTKGIERSKSQSTTVSTSKALSKSVSATLTYKQLTLGSSITSTYTKTVSSLNAITESNRESLTLVATCEKPKELKDAPVISFWQEVIQFGEGTTAYTANTLCRYDRKKPACPSAYCVDGQCDTCSGLFKNLTRARIESRPSKFDYEGLKNKLEDKYDKLIYEAGKLNEKKRERLMSIFMSKILEAELKRDNDAEIKRLNEKNDEIERRWKKNLNKKKAGLLKAKTSEINEFDKSRISSQKHRN